jgi:hypothetical protein
MISEALRRCFRPSIPGFLHIARRHYQHITFLQMALLALAAIGLTAMYWPCLRVDFQ